MSKFKIRHITRYIYDSMVRDSANQIMLYPIEDEQQDIVEHSISITGNPPVDIYRDYYGNKVGTFTHAQPHNELVIDSRLIITTMPIRKPETDQPAAAQWADIKNLGSDLRFIDFMKQEKFAAQGEVKKIVDAELQGNPAPLDAALKFCQYIYDAFTYKKGITTIETTLDEIWTLKSGVCQDFAHLLLSMLRMTGIPARYVSGYICPNKPGMRGEGATHAWVEAYIPFYGWLGVDPTNNTIVNETHVRLAVGKNFTDCSPVKGTYRGTANHTLEVAVSVSYEDGRTENGDNEITLSKPVTSVSQNSYRKFQEMQMQQQQQQQ